MPGSDDEVKKVVKKPVAKKAAAADESDEEEVKTKKAPAKKAAASKKDESSDEETAPKKAPAKKAAAAKKVESSDDEEEVQTKKAPAKTAPKKAAAKKGDDSSSEDETTAKRPARRGGQRGAAALSDDEKAAPRTRHADPSALDSSDSDDDNSGAASSADLVDLIDYDTMTEEAFLEHLKSQTKAHRLEEKRLVRERQELEADDEDEADDRHFDGVKAYSYRFMLDRILNICQKNNPELAQTERIKLPMPKIERHSAKKTALTNFKEICQALNRSMEDVKDYVEKSLTTQGSIDGSNCLILRYQNAKVSAFEKLMVKYVEEYCKCMACGRIKTELSKESASRLLLMKCKDCGASRYIQVGGAATFKAQTTKRSKARNNAMI